MAENTQAKKLTFKDIINAKINKDKEKDKTVDIQVKSLGGLVTFNAPPVKFTKQTMAAIREKDKDKASRAQDNFIYSCCPEVKAHYKELMEAYEVKIPTDLVDALFNTAEQDTIMSKLMEMAGFDMKKLQEEIKNS